MDRFFYLTPVLGGPGAPRYPIHDSPTLIGRAEDSSIALLEPTVSRRHATIQFREGKVYLEDLESKHGTFVNSKLITRTTLKVGDIVVFGLSLVLRLEQSDNPLPPVAVPQFPAQEENVTAVRETRSFSDNLNRNARRQNQDEEEERLRDQLVKLHKLAATGALCATTLPQSYERLTGVRQAVERGDVSLPPPLADALYLAIDELNGLMQNLRLESPYREPTRLTTVIDNAFDVVRALARSHKVALKCDVPPNISVLVDPVRLRAAAVEVLRNAIASSPPGQAVETIASAANRHVTLSVVDHGAGIAPEILKRVFDPLQTHRQDRTAIGLGLFEARHLLLSMGGDLALESDEIRGTVVRIRLDNAQTAKPS